MNIFKKLQKLFFGTDIIVPDNVTHIEPGAFAGWNGYTSVIIPNNVTSIGRYAFSRCTDLTSITIPDSVTWICNGVFSGCNSLKRVTIGNSVTSIGLAAFNGCNSLSEIYCKSQIPPKRGANCFKGVDVTTCKLYVPKGSKEAYQACGFENIIEE
jgi:hypothetical protein